MMQNNEIRIPRSEILKLYESSLNEISAHSVGQWLKSVTESKFIVIPTESVDQIINCSTNSFTSFFVISGLCSNLASME